MISVRKFTGAAVAVAVLAGCNATGAGTMTPVNPAAQSLGSPQFEYTQAGIGHGAVAVTMPNGERLTGSWSVAVGGGLVTGFGPGGSTSAFASSGGGNFFAQASGPNTSLVCQGNVSLGHGGGMCSTPGGAVYQMLF